MLSIRELPALLSSAVPSIGPKTRQHRNARPRATATYNESGCVSELCCLPPCHCNMPVMGSGTETPRSTTETCVWSCAGCRDTVAEAVGSVGVYLLCYWGGTAQRCCSTPGADGSCGLRQTEKNVQCRRLVAAVRLYCTVALRVLRVTYLRCTQRAVLARGANCSAAPLA